jgi:predicted naringenin-chalcone synthase
MKVYERVSVDLAEQAARDALSEAGVQPEDVTHVVVCSCTGFFAPGPDVMLIQRLGIRPSAKRTIVGFMGCFIAFQGMRTADEIVRSDPSAVVLQVCVDLCTLHLQRDPEPGTLIVDCLFGDGCAAAVYGAAERSEGGLAEVCTTASLVHGNSLNAMNWGLGHEGFLMRLSPQVPDILRTSVADFVDSMLVQAKVSPEEITDWAIHPGGRRIVEAVRDALALDDADVAHSLAVLREYGNMSSPTILFVIDRHLRAGNGTGSIVALGFGPGLSMEGAILDRV